MSATVESAAVEARDWTMSVETAANDRRMSVVPAAIARAISVPPPVIPRARADEHSTHKPARTVISVGRTRIRIIRVVSVRTNRRSGHIAGADSYPHPYPDLRLRVSQRQHQHTEQSQIS